MATVSSTFAATGQSSSLFVKSNQSLRLSITGTFVATVLLEKSRNGGQAWEFVRQITAADAAVISPISQDALYRLNCTSYTSGTVTYSITNQIYYSERKKFSSVPIGSVAYASFGTSTTPVSGTQYVIDVIVPRKITAAGIGALIGGTGGTDKFIFALYDSAGNLVAKSTTAGVTVGTANTFQEIAFDGTVDIDPGQYFILVQLNGTTARLRTVATLTFVTPVASSTAGTFATIPVAITPPTALAADTGPIAYVYES